MNGKSGEVYSLTPGFGTISPMYLLNNTLFLAGSAADNKNLVTDGMRFTTKDERGIALNTIDGKFDYRYYLPKESEKDQWVIFNDNCWFNINKEEVVYSIAEDHYLRIYDLHTKEEKRKIYSRSEYMPINFPVISDRERKNPSKYAQAYYTRFSEQPIYGVVVYDNYKKLYYRFVYLSIEYKQGMIAMKEQDNAREKSIMVFTEKGKFVGEQLLKGDYYVNNFFLTPEGLYISNANPKNPHFSEDELSFTLLEIQGI